MHKVYTKLVMCTNSVSLYTELRAKIVFFKTLKTKHFKKCFKLRHWQYVFVSDSERRILYPESHKLVFNEHAI